MTEEGIGAELAYLFDSCSEALKSCEEKKNPEREKAREDALKRLEEESRKPPSERKPPEYGSDKDFQLIQAINQLKGKPVQVSKTLVERKEEKKEE